MVKEKVNLDAFLFLHILFQMLCLNYFNSEKHQHLFIINIKKNLFMGFNNGLDYLLKLLWHQCEYYDTSLLLFFERKITNSLMSFVCPPSDFSKFLVLEENVQMLWNI